jgi:hypothetical protein
MPDGTDNINITSWPREPLSIQQIPVCIRLCEPICARSEYSIDITIFDRPVASIAVAGQTRLFNCDDKR